MVWKQKCSWTRKGDLSVECTIYELYNINCTLYHSLEAEVQLDEEGRLECGVYNLWTVQYKLYHGLEAGVQLDEEGRLEGHREHAFLHHGAVNVVVLKLETFVFFPK